MKILYVTAECWPFVKTGGLGDVSYALPKALKKEGADVRVIMPKYSTIPAYLKDQFKPVAEFSVRVGWRNQYCGIETMEIVNHVYMAMVMTRKDLHFLVMLCCHQWKN
mgnify:CR=1 FL=1